VSIGAHRIILHLTSKSDIRKAIDDIKGKVKIGLALNMETSIDSIDSYIDDISSVQLMGIDNIGFQGQQFDEKVLERVVEVRMKYPDLTITVDGGVSLETAPKLVLAGANRLIVGSAIFESDNYIEAIQKFKGINK
ncbi:MAG: HisA/HisF-related TIM barrel protein, partial [Candidatus Taylorbacteria bacterium]